MYDLSSHVPENGRKACATSSSKMREGIDLDLRDTAPNVSEGVPKNSGSSGKASTFENFVNLGQGYQF